MTPAMSLAKTIIIIIIILKSDQHIRSFKPEKKASLALREFRPSGHRRPLTVYSIYLI